MVLLTWAKSELASCTSPPIRLEPLPSSRNGSTARRSGLLCHVSHEYLKKKEGNRITLGINIILECRSSENSNLVQTFSQSRFTDWEAEAPRRGSALPVILPAV